MMSAVARAHVVTQPHQFVGYWGYEVQPELEEQLTEVLSRSCVHGAKVQRLSQHLRDSPKQTLLHRPIKPNLPCWGIAYIGLDTVPDPQTLVTGETMIAALSASGLFTYLQSEGSVLPDAWVSVRGSDCLILGREPFGRVPLYWTQVGQVIWFASQLQLLLPVVVAFQVSIAALYGYSCFSYTPTPLTPITNVFVIPAGTKQIWQSSSDSSVIAASKSERLLEWREAKEQIQDEQVAIAQLQTLLKNAVHRQIADLTHEPVGVFLSGGLDSSVVAALLVQAGVNVRAYTLDFKAACIPEYTYAEQVAQFLKIPLVKVAATPRQIRKALIPTAQAMDLPFGDGVTVPLFLLAQTASLETQVVFNGEGGDQLFAGWTNKPLIAAGVYNAFGAYDHMPSLDGRQDFIRHYLRTFHRLHGYEAAVFQPESYAQIEHLSAQDWIENALDPAFSATLLHRLRRANLMLKGAQNIQPRATNLAFAHRLRVRSLFCDLHLAEWTFQLSGKLCLQGACEKYILKRAVESWLPPEIVWRQKRGMGVPLTSWCLNELWHELGVWLNPGRLRTEGVWQPHIAAQIVAGKFGTIQGRRIGEILWLLLMWQVWGSAVVGMQSQEYSLDHPFWSPAWLGRRYLRLRGQIENGN